MEQNKYKRIQEIEQDIKEYVEYLKFELGVSSGEIIFDENLRSIMFNLVEDCEETEQVSESEDIETNYICYSLGDMSEEELNDLVDIMIDMLS